MARRTRSIQTPDSAEVPISAMIDVVFLLIIFFVITAAIDKEIEDAAVNLAKAPHGRPVSKKDPRTIVINVHADGKIFMGMHQVTPQEITDQLNLLKSKYKDAVDVPIVVRGDYRTQHYYINEVFRAITETQLYKVRLVAQVEQE